MFSEPSWLPVMLQGCFLSPWPAAAPKRSPVRTRCWPCCRPTDRTSATSWWTSCWVWWCCWWSPVDTKQQSCWRSHCWISADVETSSEVLLPGFEKRSSFSRDVREPERRQLLPHDEQSFRFIGGQSSIVTPFIPDSISDARPRCLTPCPHWRVWLQFAYLWCFFSEDDSLNKKSQILVWETVQHKSDSVHKVIFNNYWKNNYSVLYGEKHIYTLEAK